MAIRKGSKVSHSILGGLWEVITRETPMSAYRPGTRYTLRNLKTREFVMGVRDKDIRTKNHPLFYQLVQLGD
jgi:hypothetical protein